MIYCDKALTLAWMCFWISVAVQSSDSPAISIYGTCTRDFIQMGNKPVLPILSWE